MIIVAAFFAAVIFCLLDFRAEKYKKVLEKELGQSSGSISQQEFYDSPLDINSSIEADDNDEHVSGDDKKFNCLLFLQDIWKSLKQVHNFGFPFWIVTVLSMNYVVLIYSFLDFSQTIFTVRYGYSESDAGLVSAIIAAVALVCTPLFGFLLDKFGKRGYALLAASFLYFFSFVLFTLYQTEGLLYVSMVTLGLAFSATSASILPCITFIVAEEQYGIAFGIMVRTFFTSFLLTHFTFHDSLGCSNEHIYVDYKLHSGPLFRLERLYLCLHFLAQSGGIQCCHEHLVQR